MALPALDLVVVTLGTELATLAAGQALLGLGTGLVSPTLLADRLGLSAPVLIVASTTAGTGLGVQVRLRETPTHRHRT